jgi:hypothetical protein
MPYSPGMQLPADVCWTGALWSGGAERCVLYGRACVQVEYALDALERAMKWDEEVYGLEYDLDLFNIVAVDDFNMVGCWWEGGNCKGGPGVVAEQKGNKVKGKITDMGSVLPPYITCHKAPQLIRCFPKCWPRAMLLLPLCELLAVWNGGRTSLPEPQQHLLVRVNYPEVFRRCCSAQPLDALDTRLHASGLPGHPSCLAACRLYRCTWAEVACRLPGLGTSGMYQADT